MIAWNELLRYRREEVPRGGSSFAPWAQHRMPHDATVVDLGTGNGRDAMWFARRRHPVVACDFSGAAVRQTRRKLQRRGVRDPDVGVVVLNDARSVLLMGAELAREPSPPYLYARHLVGCLDEDARANLWRLCSMSLRRGGALFLELSGTRADLGSSMVDGLVQRLPVEELVAEMSAAGGHVVHLEQGSGHDFFDQPDPLVARLEVRWSPDRTPITSHQEQS